MKVMGAVLIFVGALYAFLLYRQRSLYALRLRRALAGDLAVLKNGICIYRRTLPSICENDLKKSPGAERFWDVMLQYLSEGELPAQGCWDKSIENLPEAISGRLAPLGPLLSGGGASLAGAIDEVRESILEDLREQEQRMSVSMRLAAAMYLSGACALVLVLA